MQGLNITLAKKSNGTLWAWGGNTYGQCGNATPPNSVATPLQVGTATNWQNISAGNLSFYWPHKQMAAYGLGA